jgi:UDP-glucose 4-epimerase
VTRALVTGAAGFIGSHVVDACLDLGFEVVGVDNLSGGFVENLNPDVEFRQGDLNDGVFVESLFTTQQFDYVYHLAAYAAEGLSHFIRVFNYQTNLVASMRLINEAVKHKVGCLVFASSIAVYGANQTPMTEELTPAPEDPYGISKYAVELDLASAARMFGLPYVIFRPHNVYGERQNLADRYRNVIGIFMNRVMQGKPMPIFGDGQQTRAFSHVEDVAPVMARSVLVPLAQGEVFNIGADQAVTVDALAGEIAAAFGVERSVTHLPPRMEVVHAFASHAKVQRVFGVKPTVGLQEGIRRMTAWARERGPMSAATFGDIELTEGLPPSWRV